MACEKGVSIAVIVVIFVDSSMVELRLCAKEERKKKTDRGREINR
jgi:hypothetical protein